MSELTSRDNPKIKQMRALRNRKERESSGLFLVEGIFHIGEAIAAAEAGCGYHSVEYICYSPGLLSSDFALGLIERQKEKGLPCYMISEGLFSTLSGRENPQGILAVARRIPTRLGDLTPESFPWGVGLVAPQDPGNIGSILRTIDAVGASGLILIDSSADPYHPSAVRASMGSLFWHPVTHTTFGEFAVWIRKNGYHLVGSSSHAETDYRASELYRKPLVQLMGSEREGLSKEQAQRCEAVVRMPMEGRVTSLNLAVAAGILLYEARGKLDRRLETEDGA
jgi:TrmH family RNA methyltransferase